MRFEKIAVVLAVKTAEIRRLIRHRYHFCLSAAFINECPQSAIRSYVPVFANPHKNKAVNKPLGCLGELCGAVVGIGFGKFVRFSA